MNLSDQRVVDETRGTENLFITVRQLQPLGKRLDEVIADRIVLKRENVVH